MFHPTALLATLILSTCPNGQCLIPFEASPGFRTLPPSPAVVRVINRSSQSSSLGSGTVIKNEKERSIVLTCAHLFSEGVGNVQIRFSSGKSVSAKLVAIDRKWDLAALTIPPTTVRPPPIAAQAPRQGDRLSSCGYGPNGTFQVNRGTLRGYVRASGTKSFETLEMTGAARQGDSGGPILNQMGELVAVLWGSDGRTVGGTYCGRICRFLAPLLQPPDPSPSTEQPSALPVAPSWSASTPKQTDNDDDASKERKSLAERLGQLHDGVSKFHGRIESISDRLQRIERVSSKIQELGLLEGSAGSMTWLTPVLAALGWTGPPSIALIIGLKLLSRIVRRRIRKKIAGKKSESATSDESKRSSILSTINDDYGKQLAQVYALSGRSPIGDLTLGREYDEELRKAEVSSDAQLAKWAGALRRRVADRFNRIHSSSPAPADPIEN
ncbi:MAG: serine protease [Planctomycetia bacterium]|jgi:hypothetical protein